MNFVGIDLHTNRFTCSYRDGQAAASPAKGRGVTETFELNEAGLASFYETLNEDTYVLVEATITTFSFVRLFKDLVKEVIIANTYELKQISMARCNTDKLDADKLCRILRAQVLSGDQFISPVTLPPEEIQELRSLFATYRGYKKQQVQTKNRIHSLLKEHLYGFTQEAIFSREMRERIRGLGKAKGSLSFQINLLLDRLERDEADIKALKDQILVAARPYMKEIEILTSMKGVSIFIAAAIMADIISVGRFKDSKAFTSYLRSAPKVSNSNTTTSIRGTNKQGRKLAATLLTQSLHHVLKSSEKLSRWYERLCRYKKRGLVRTGLRRRILAEIYQMLKKGEYHYGRDAKKHEEKMAQYRRFLERQKNRMIVQNIA